MKRNKTIIEPLPIIPIEENVIFPHTEAILTISDAAIPKIIEESTEKVLMLTLQKKLFESGEPSIELIGTLAKIQRIFKTDKVTSILVQGLSRVKISEVMQLKPYIKGKINETNLEEVFDDEIQAMQRHLKNELQSLIDKGRPLDYVVLLNIISETHPIHFAYKLASILDLQANQKQELLEINNLKDLFFKLNDLLAHELKILDVEKKISQKTQEKLAKETKEAILKERMETIREELGQGKDEGGLEELRNKIKLSKMPEEVEKKAESELNRLKSMTILNPEYSYIRSYLGWLVDLPWSQKTPSGVDLRTAEEILNEDHFGLQKIKERILEYLAVLKLRSQKEESKATPQANILCFIGPPGVGKTSIGKSIAKALNRKFTSISLGGLKDEAEIRGHRRTYVGALPGRIIQGIKNTGAKNPVFMMDEIDKISSSFLGDPGAALIEVLDPEQNKFFIDNYLEIPFDLSQVFFITTGNLIDTIPPALRDRLEVIYFSGYTEDEKFHIAKDFLFKKLLNTNALDKNDIKLTDEALKLVIHGYTREAGVRNLERELNTIFRKVARQKVEGKKGTINIDINNLSDYLGQVRFKISITQEKDSIGVAPILAWTEMGGEVMFVEVALMSGKGELILTGQLGEVMRESCKAALSYIRSNSQIFQIDKKNFYQKTDIHVHVPRGAVPKDGPSAGLAIAIAMLSSITRKPVKRDVGLSGEITLNGRILEVGGLKEKVIAAHRAGIKTIILPQGNEHDIEEVPQHIRKDLNIIFISEIKEAIDNALVK